MASEADTRPLQRNGAARTAVAGPAHRDSNASNLTSPTLGRVGYIYGLLVKRGNTFQLGGPTMQRSHAIVDE